MQFIVIEKNPKIALKYEAAGADRIMIDLESLGKSERQKGLNSVISDHTLEDIETIRPQLSKAKLMVRTNPWHTDSRKEVEHVIERGAKILMLPMFHDPEEVQCYQNAVKQRAQICLLLETPQALVRAEEILRAGGFDELYIGLNDLSLALGLDFMFELLAGGIIDHLTRLCQKYRIPFGFGGVGTLEDGDIPGKMIIEQHARLGSTLAILSQVFKNHSNQKENELATQISGLRRSYAEAKQLPAKQIEKNMENTFHRIWQVATARRKNQSFRL